MDKKIKLALVDDNDTYRKILTNYLTKFKDLEIIIESFNGKEFISALSTQKPDIVLLDLEMPVMDGRETTAYLSEHHPEIKILILTIHRDENLSQELIKKGANGFLLKDNGFSKVIDAIYSIAKHQYYFAGWDLKKILLAKNRAANINEGKHIPPLVQVNFTAADSTNVLLSEQEKIILQHICAGLSSKMIGEKMFLSYRTIENKRIKLYEKTGANSLAELIKFALSNQL